MLQPCQKQQGSAPQGWLGQSSQTWWHRGAAAKTRRHRQTLVTAATRFRPCIDLHKGKVKQIVGSTLDTSTDDGLKEMITNYESDRRASFFAELYDKCDLPGGHAILLDQSPETRRAAFESVMTFSRGLQVGGGVTADTASEFLDAGASHVIVTSWVFTDGKIVEERLKQLVQQVGKERLVLDLSCRRREPGGPYHVVTDRWQKFSNFVLSKESLTELAQSCDEFLVHGVDQEGKRLGIDEDLVSLLASHSPIPVTYAGGVRSLDDLERVKHAGQERVDVTVGSALDIFGGELPFDDVVRWHRSQQ